MTRELKNELLQTQQTHLSHPALQDQQANLGGHNHQGNVIRCRERSVAFRGTI